MTRAALLVVLGACARDPVPAPVPDPTPSEIVIPLQTDNGLSDLALAPDGALWTVAERTRTAFRVTLDGDRVAAIERVAITGVPDGVDIEAIDVIDPGTLILGTEAHDTADAGLWRATRAADGSFAATVMLSLSAGANHGVEGVCGLDGGDTVVGAIEAVEVVHGERWARVLVPSFTTPGALPAPTLRHVRLTSETGKLSAIDCARADDGAIDVVAIERHFEVTRIVAFTLGAETEVEARVVADLADLARGRNFEGLARLPDGRYALVVDNQWKTIEGDNQLVLVTPGSTSRAP